jgi:hypothetical protein
MSAEAYLLAVGKEMRPPRTAEEIQPIINKVVIENWCANVDDLRGIPEERWEKWNIPFQFVAELRAKLDSSSAPPEADAALPAARPQNARTEDEIESELMTLESKRGAEEEAAQDMEADRIQLEIYSKQLGLKDDKETAQDADVEQHPGAALSNHGIAGEGPHQLACSLNSRLKSSRVFARI